MENIHPDNLLGYLSVNGWFCMLCDPDANCFTFLVGFYRHLHTHHNIQLNEYSMKDGPPYGFIVKNPEGGPF